MNNMKIWLMLILTSFLPWAAFGIDKVRCSRMLNDGWYKTYRWRGVGNKFPDMTNETKRNGSSKAQSDIWSEGTTAAFDPKFSSNYSSYMTQVISSFGDCSLFALKERKNQRDLYIAQNFAQVRKEIAEGRGLHMETLAFMSLCEVEAQADFNNSLQSGFEELYSEKTQTVGFKIDQIINSSTKLNQQCFNLSSI